MFGSSFEPDWPSILGALFLLLGDYLGCDALAPGGEVGSDEEKVVVGFYRLAIRISQSDLLRCIGLGGVVPYCSLFSFH